MGICCVPEGCCSGHDRMFLGAKDAVVVHQAQGSLNTSSAGSERQAPYRLACQPFFIA